jgi:alpha-pyrone synthase
MSSSRQQQIGYTIGMPVTVIESIATSNPPYCVAQTDAARNMQRVEQLSAPLRKRVAQVYRLSGIERRFTCVADYARDPDLIDFDPGSWPVSHFSSTLVRNEHYRASVIPMAEKAARQSLADACVAPNEITHVVVVSCTGFFAPGLDIHLVRSLGMHADTRRTVIGFMGCYAAFNALRLADAFCRADSGARVLIVCAELCSLHFQIESSLESVVVNSLFADGAAAAIVRSRMDDDPEVAGKLTYVSGHTLLDDNSLEHMSWSIGDHGFLMGLSPRVPEVLARRLPEYIARVLDDTRTSRRDIGFWAIHPGGRQIVEKAQQVLELSDDDVSDSMNILRNYGNMSAPTILFILKRIADRLRESAGNGGVTNGVAMAFGPGLTIEGCLLRMIGPA